MLIFSPRIYIRVLGTYQITFLDFKEGFSSSKKHIIRSFHGNKKKKLKVTGKVTVSDK